MMGVLSDYGYAMANKDFAANVRSFVGTDKRIYFAGHWGLQYYMEERSYEPYDFSAPPKGDFILVVPTNNRMDAPLSHEKIHLVDSIVYKNRTRFTLMNYEANAGFYSSFEGYFPYMFSDSPHEVFYLYQILNEA
jgi:hypothetical protein